MDAQSALDELEQLAEHLDVTIQYDHFTGEGSGAGGLCKVKGKWRVIMERSAAKSEKVAMLARCLSRFDSDGHFVSPAVRDLLSRSHAQ